MKTGILVHGYNLNAENWMDVAWGRPLDQLGRVPRAVLLAAQMDVDIMVFGTGASQRDGVKEGEWTIRYLMDHFEKLSDFSCFSSIDLASLQSEIAGVALAELGSTNTDTESAADGKIFCERGMECILVVSSPDHIFRCHKLMYVALTGLGTMRLRRNLFAVGSDVSYRQGRLVEDVKIDER